MVLKSLTDTLHLLKHPVLLIPGIYAGLVVAVAIWLEFSGGEFIAGKILFLGAVLSPFFIGGALGCMSRRDYSLRSFCTLGLRYFFPVLLPVIVAATISILLLILFSIPFAIAGITDPSMIAGLFIGITVPVIIFAFFAENSAVAEDLAVLASLKQSMMIASRAFLNIVSCVFVSCIFAGVLMMIIATIWGVILTDKFSQYLDLGMAEQQKIFSGYGLADWQRVLGPDGIMVTAGMIGLFVLFLGSFFIVYKHQCYLAASLVEPKIVEPVGEYDEKGRWYKY